MDELELACFKMISVLGAARSSFVESMRCSRQHQFEQAILLLEEGEAYRQQGHEHHFKLLQKDSEQALKSLPLLLVHAEDQLMSCEVLEIVARELLETHQMIAALLENKGE